MPILSYYYASTTDAAVATQNFDLLAMFNKINSA